MTEEQQFDEELIAKIIAAAESNGLKVARMPGARGPSGRWCGFGVDSVDGSIVPAIPDGPVCAIGAGVLYDPPANARIHAADEFGDVCDNATSVFAQEHGVSDEYAIGVSDGFEGWFITTERINSCNWRDEVEDVAGYERGVAVGEAVRTYFEDGDS